MARTEVEAAPRGVRSPRNRPLVKPVITITTERLPAVANALLETMIRDGFVPDAVVGIATGGQRLVEALPARTPFHVMHCTSQRPGTAVKSTSGFFKTVIRWAPYAVTNWLRRWEDWCNERPRLTPACATPELDQALATVSRTIIDQGFVRVAVVDDAVDSGKTLAVVVEGLKRRLPSEADIRTAVVTQTRPAHKVVACPDYALHLMTLCRFPWSFDYRGAR